MIITRQTEPENFSDNLKEEILEYIRKLELEEFIISKSYIAGKNITFLVNYKGCDLYIVSNNWGVFGNDRGGSVKTLSASMQRTLPCNNPFREICIAYNGDFKPCCNIYFGEDTTIGNINEISILDVYFGSIYTEYRRHLLCFSEKNGKCATCNAEDNAKIETKLQRETLLRNL
jgi:hypothetical protein